MKKRSMELDALRGGAALVVVLYHYSTRYGEIYGHTNPDYFSFKYGYLGVNLFFMISGFVIFMTLSRINEVSEFIQKRVVRLFPAYLAAVVLTFGIVSIFGLDGRDVSFRDAILNLTMLQGFLPGLVEHVDGAYWSLTVEISFYVLMAFVVHYRLRERIYTISSIWLSTSLVILLLGSVDDQNFIVGALRYYTIAEYAHLFVAGIMFYLMRVKPDFRNHVFVFCCVALQFIFNPVVDSLFVGTFFFMFYLMANQKLGFLNNKILVFFGTISYSLYLIHQNIGYVIIKSLESTGLTSSIYLFIPISLSVALAVIITYYIERPITKYFGKVFNNNTEISYKESRNA